MTKMAKFPFKAAWAVANRMGWLGAPPVGSSPHLNPRALARWREAIARSRVYLEYGAGGSTMEALRSVAHVVSVETDLRYLRGVARAVAAQNGTGDFHPVHVDIGWTEKWGRPLVTRGTDARAARWRRYPGAAWDVLGELALVPDFVFVDGRFRTASVLEAMIRLPDDAECLFMLDDFDRRTGLYGDVLHFARDVETFDRTIVFRRNSAFDRDRCRAALEKAYAVSE